MEECWFVPWLGPSGEHVYGEWCLTGGSSSGNENQSQLLHVELVEEMPLFIEPIPPQRPQSVPEPDMLAILAGLVVGYFIGRYSKHEKV